MASCNNKYKFTPDCKLDVEQKSKTTNDYGEVVYTWSNYTSTWGQMVKESGGELIENEQIVSLYKTSFKVRYIANITEEMRVVYNSNNYDIEAVVEEGRNKYLVLHCKKWDNNR